MLRSAVSDYIDRIVDGRELHQRVITQPRPIADNRLPLGGDAPPAAKAIVDLTQWAKPGGEGDSGKDRGATQRGAAQAVGLAGPMNAPMKKTARRVK